jgi:hypothetical protein
MAGDDNPPSVALLQHQLAEKTAALDAAAATSRGGDDGQGPNMNAFGERLAKLEGAFEGMRQLQTVTFVVLAALTTVVIGLVGYNLKRTDDLSEKLSSLPKQISTELRDLTTTLSGAITASKQTPPQVILLPAPAPQPPPEPKPK